MNTGGLEHGEAVEALLSNSHSLSVTGGAKACSGAPLRREHSGEGGLLSQGASCPSRGKLGVWPRG